MIKFRSDMQEGISGQKKMKEEERKALKAQH
jgi:hypothetical protein